ncbi:MAG: dihydroorotase [Candidatus Limnocylindrales bacterium]
MIEQLDLDDVCLIDPWLGRSGPARLEIRDGLISGLSWRASRGTDRAEDPRLLVLPGLMDLHAHLREPGDATAETIGSGLAAAAHGGFTTVVSMANTDPPLDRVALLHGATRAAQKSGSPVRLLPGAATTLGRAGTTLVPMAALAEAGAACFSDDGSPVADPSLFRSALAHAGAVGRVLVEHPEETALTVDAEAGEGLAATVLGLRGAPVAAEVSAVGRALAILEDVCADAPADTKPRLHLTHLSCGGSVDLVRRAKAARLPVTCDVTPHHLCLHDGWLGGDRRFSWEVGELRWPAAAVDGPPYDPNTRVNPPLRSPSDALALARAVADGTVDAVATDHAPHAPGAKAVPYGEAANGISGIETALGLLLAAVRGGVLGLDDVARALTLGPARVLGEQVLGWPPNQSPLQEGAPADLVVVDRGGEVAITPEWLRSRGKNSPLLGRRLPGRVILTVAGGRVAFEADGVLGAALR